MLQTGYVGLICCDVALKFDLAEHHKAGLEMKAVSLNGCSDTLQCWLHK